MNDIKIEIENIEKIKLPFYLKAWFIILVFICPIIFSINWLGIIGSLILLIFRSKKTDEYKKSHSVTKILITLYVIYMVIMLLYTFLIVGIDSPTSTEDQSYVVKGPTKVGEVNKSLDDSTEVIGKEEQEILNENKAIKIISDSKLPKFSTTLGELYTDYGFIKELQSSKIKENVYIVTYIYNALDDILDDGKVSFEVDIDKKEIVNITGSITVLDRFNNVETPIKISNIDELQDAFNHYIPYYRPDDVAYGVEEFGFCEPSTVIKAITIPDTTDNNNTMVVLEIKNISDKPIIINRKAFDTIDSNNEVYPSYGIEEYRENLTNVTIPALEVKIVSFGVNGDITKPLNLRYQYSEGKYVQFILNSN